MIAEAVYLLCGLTSFACAALLVRAYFRTRARLLMWSSLGFLGLAVNNVMLVCDMIIFPSVDLSLWRTVPALIGMLLLVLGLVWESR